MANRMISSLRPFLTGMILLAALALTLMSVQILLAQMNKGTLKGLVTNPSGAIVVEATIELTNQATQQTQTKITDASGQYLFDAVEAGRYDLKVTAQGFAGFVKTGLEIRGEPTTLDVQLGPGPAQVSQGPTPARGGTIEATTIADLPIASRNPVALVLTLPGASSNRYGPGVDTFPINARALVQITS